MNTWASHGWRPSGARAPAQPARLYPPVEVCPCAALRSALSPPCCVNGPRYPKSGNAAFARGTTLWTLGERGVLSVSELRHHLASAPGETPSLYRVNDNVVVSLDVMLLEGGKAVPYKCVAYAHLPACQSVCAPYSCMCAVCFAALPPLKHRVPRCSGGINASAGLACVLGVIDDAAPNGLTFPHTRVSFCCCCCCCAARMTCRCPL
jgi:hypothetical protein